VAQGDDPSSIDAQSELNRDPFANGAATPGSPESARLPLGNLWPDDPTGAKPPSSRVLSARKHRKAPPGAPHCVYCAGELVRSRMRFYERVLALFTSSRPYRCLDCRSRRWHQS
jgi:hypothetical protein